MGPRLTFTVLAGLAVAVAACDPPPPDAPASAPAQAVKTIAIESGETAATRTFSGAIAASETMRLSFAIGGKLIDVPVREGERITAGQAVARLDPVDVEREIASASARRAAAQSRLADGDNEYRRLHSLVVLG